MGVLKKIRSIGSKCGGGLKLRKEPLQFEGGAVDRIEGCCVSRTEALVAGRFIARLNRFLGLVRLEDGAVMEAHITDSGRLKELLVPGQRIYVARKRPYPRRKTQFDLALVDLEGTLVSVDATLPNRLIYEALAAGALPGLGGYVAVEAEARYGSSRFDFRLSRRGDLVNSGSNVPAEAFPGQAPPASDCLVEVKSVTLVRDGVALFPDAPTTRGTRHLKQLMEAKKDNLGAWVIFVIQREDANLLRPNIETDPDFAASLQDALEHGVNVLAYTCGVSLEKVCLARQVPLGN